MPVITQKTDYDTHALGRLLSQFKAKPVIAAIHAAISAEVQALEDMFISMQTLLQISTQTGIQLDNIGTILNEARDGASDADYRTALLARIAQLYASGTGEDLIAAAINAAGAAQVDLVANYPAGIDIDIDVAEPSGFLATMEAAAVAGVRIGLLDLFVWNDDDGALWNDSDTIYVTHESSG